MSTKSSQHPNSSGRVPFQARHKVILVTVIILLIAAGAWITVYTRAVGTAPIGGTVPVISPSESVH
jgi:fructose-specific phosphotransferase system IIC component